MSDQEYSFCALKTTVEASMKGAANKAPSLRLREPVVDWVIERAVGELFIWDFEFGHHGAGLWEAEKIAGGLQHLENLSPP